MTAGKLTIYTLLIKGWTREWVDATPMSNEEMCNNCQYVQVHTEPQPSTKHGSTMHFEKINEAVF